MSNQVCPCGVIHHVIPQKKTIDFYYRPSSGGARVLSLNPGLCQDTAGLNVNVCSEYEKKLGLPSVEGGKVYVVRITAEVVREIK